MTVVLDASAAFEIAMYHPKRDLYLKMIAEADEVIAPELFIAECTNVAWKYQKAGYLDEQNAKLTLAYVLKSVTKYALTSDYSVEVLHESVRLNHPSYDIFYFVLARHNAATLLTIDQKLASLCRENGVDVA